MNVDSLEYRADRPYDETAPATVIHPNGTLIKIGQRHDGLAAACVREVLALAAA